MKKFVIACSLLLLSLLAYQQFRLSQKVTIPGPTGQRLISLSPTLTETLFELGSGDQLVGVTTYCVYPPEAQKKEKIGDFVNPNLEKMLGLKPDLIFAERWSSSKVVSRLRESGLQVVELSSPKSIAEIYEMILQIGRSLNREASARDVVDEMKRKIGTIQAQGVKMTWHPGIYVEIDPPSWTVGRTSYTSEAIELCGARNIFRDIVKPALQVSSEAVIERNPDVILSFGSPLSEYRERPGWGRIKAIEQGRVIHDVGQNLLSHGNHRLVVGMEQLQARLLEMQPHEH